MEPRTQNSGLRRTFLACALALLASCEREPVIGPVSLKEVKLRKVVVYATEEAIEGHFSLENERAQQLALKGRLTLSCYLHSKVTVEDQPGFNVKSEIYRGSSEVKVGDYQWIFYHSFLTDDDFVCRFRIPFQKFQSKPPEGRYIGFKLEFRADDYPSALEAERQIWIPSK